jgi:predicted alpha/beta-fold hydrolase
VLACDGVEPEGYRPARWLPGGHLQTIVPPLLQAPWVDGRDEVRVVPVAEETAVRVHVARPAGTARGTLLLVHGMGGSVFAPYMLRTTRQALDRGWAVARMNLRNCGRTEALSRTLYNAGQWADVERVLEDLDAASLPRPFAAAGFSIGGNLVLLYAGRAAVGCRADAVAGVNPPVDLEACCRALERPGNLLYQVHFTRLLCRQIRRVRRVRPLPGPEASAWRIRTVRRFDRLFTAPDGGFASPEDYYATSSAGPHLASARVPALVLSAADDPFVPVEIFAPCRQAGRAELAFAHPRRGGHLGYWQSAEPRFWAGKAVLDYFESVLGL